MIKWTIRLILLVASITLIWWIAGKINPDLGFGSLFKSSPLLIDDTPVLITEIKSLNQLFTVTSMDEVVISEVKPAETGSLRNILHMTLPMPGMAVDKIVLVARGKVMAGADLSRLSEKDIFIREDSISLRLPRAVILDIIINPSDTETFMETGNWSPEAVTKVKLKAKELLRIRALEQGILNKADEQALKVMSGFLHTMGFQKVRVYN
ncbi:DUF4230 domain-containing protein [Flavihumibacter rivuli]|uniref:DUF4230 domain-containing protein n=1 Tax=Flavihumibacter rivuli TaxID=2838156 RepID=UPI001BDEFBD7|nr:DUF4230 domain-containing protein [Flavihumibacter rivuli]ULQ58124.1 DUF4230 domain-containing protein [Flavihumibacter rivuli]